jgi:hypothetical protein|tara:strand:- start:346 stop:1308 length:963 start_codon:yes stop_codon:yes gene_type:complete
MAMSTANMDLLTRSEIWSGELKEILRDEMMAQRYVRMLDGFPDGNQFTIPSIGQAQVDNYVEDAAVVYRPMDTGEFTFTVDKYLSSASYITKKAEQDAFYSAELMSRFVPEQERAVMAHFETTTFATPEAGVTANSNEAIDGVEHRWSAGGTGAVITVQDFARARFALKKANVPDTNLIAIVDPSCEYTINTLTALSEVSNNPRWEGIVADGIATGMTFVKNIYGFDVYTSNYLTDVTDGALPTAANAGVDFSSVNGKANLFFSAAATVTPFVGAWRQMPEVDYEYNKDFQRHEYVTTARYGVKLYRPENMVRVVTKTNV